MSDRIARECYICSEERNRTGDETIQVMYKKLSQHLKVKHALSAEQARSAASRLKRMGALKKSAAGRNYFMCIECRCVVVRKDNHLFSKYHRMVAGTTEYHRAMKTLFKRAQHAMHVLGFPCQVPCLRWIILIMTFPTLSFPIRMIRMIFTSPHPHPHQPQHQPRDSNLRLIILGI